MAFYLIFFPCVGTIKLFTFKKYAEFPDGIVAQKLSISHFYC